MHMPKILLFRELKTQSGNKEKNGEMEHPFNRPLKKRQN